MSLPAPARLGKDQDRECARYDVTDGHGVRLGCRLDDVTSLPPHVTVTVSGGGASCSDVSLHLQRVGECLLCARVHG